MCCSENMKRLMDRSGGSLRVLIVDCGRCDCGRHVTDEGRVTECEGRVVEGLVELRRNGVSHESALRGLIKAARAWEPDVVLIAERDWPEAGVGDALANGLAGRALVSVVASGPRERAPLHDRIDPLLDAPRGELRRTGLGREEPVPWRRSGRSDGHSHPAIDGSLTDRERAVLCLIGRGLSRTEIAHALSRSPKTIDGHQARILRKLGVGSRAELIRTAIVEGLDDPVET